MRWFEILPLAVIALLIFGPKRMPEIGASIGKTIREFQKSIREVTGGFDGSIGSIMDAPEPAKSTLPQLPPTGQDLPAAAQLAEAQPVPAETLSDAESGAAPEVTPEVVATEPVSAATSAQPGGE